MSDLTVPERREPNPLQRALGLGPDDEPLGLGVRAPEPSDARRTLGQAKEEEDEQNRRDAGILGGTEPDTSTPADPSLPNDYAFVVEDIEDGEFVALRASIQQALLRDPDTVAEAQRLGLPLGVDSALVERDLAGWRRLLARRQLETLISSMQSPVLAAQLRDPEFAALAFDDADDLSTIEGIARNFSIGATQTAVNELYSRQRDRGLTAAEQQELASYLAYLRETEPASGLLSASAELVGQFTPIVRDALFGAGAGAGAAGLARQIPGPIGLMFRSADAARRLSQAGALTASAVGVFKLEGGGIYQEQIEAGIDPAVAAWTSRIGGALSAAVELAGFGVVARLAGPRAETIRAAFRKHLFPAAERLSRPTITRAGIEFAKSAVETFVTEVATENVQEVIGFGASQAGRVLTGREPESLEVLGDRLAQVTAKMAQGMALLSFVPSPVLALVSDVRAAARSRADIRTFDALQAKAEASKTRRRSPDAFAEFLRATLPEDAEATDIYIDARRLREVLQQGGREEFEAAFPDVAGKIDEAAEQGADVSIPIDEYTAKAAGSGISMRLREHIRLDPDSPSLAEIRDTYGQGGERLASEAANILQEKAMRDQAFARSARAVRAEMLRDIIDTGRVSPQDARVLASFYRDFVAVLAARLGKTPAAIHSQWRLRFLRGDARTSPPGAQFEQLGEQPANLELVDIPTAELEQRLDEAYSKEAPQEEIDILETELARREIELDPAEFIPEAAGEETEITGIGLEDLLIQAAQQGRAEGLSPSQLGRRIRQDGDIAVIAQASPREDVTDEELGREAYDALQAREARVERMRAISRQQRAPGPRLRLASEAIAQELRERDRPYRHWEPPTTKTGKLKGAPEWVKTRADHNRLRAQLRRLAREGAAARDWYARSAKAILDMVGGDVGLAERFAQLVAIYSPRTDIWTNILQAVRAFTHWRMGKTRETFRVGTRVQDKKAIAALYDNKPWEGRKTNSFYLNLMAWIAKHHPRAIRDIGLDDNLQALLAKPVTVDVWIARAFGFNTDAVGNDKGSGQYQFAENEIRRLAAEFNDAVPDGDQLWEPEEIQASIWAATRTRWMHPEVVRRTNRKSAKDGLFDFTEDGRVLYPQSGPKRVKHLANWRRFALEIRSADAAAAVQRGNRDFADEIARAAHTITWSPIPQGHAISRAEPSLQDRFRSEAMAILLDEQGNDALAAQLGVALTIPRAGFASWTPDGPQLRSSVIDTENGLRTAALYAKALQFIFRLPAVPVVRPDPRSVARARLDFLVQKDGRTIRRFQDLSEASRFAARRKGAVVRGAGASLGAVLRFDGPPDMADLFNAVKRAVGDEVELYRLSADTVMVVNHRDQDGLPVRMSDQEFTRRIAKLEGRKGVLGVVATPAEVEYGSAHDWEADPEGNALASAIGDAGGSPRLVRWLRDRRLDFERLLDRYADAPGEGQAQRIRDAIADLQEPSGAGRLEGWELAPEDQPEGIEQRVQLVTREERPVKHSGPIRKPADAAQVFASLQRLAAERVEALVTDEQGKPLAIVGGFKGAPNAARVEFGTLVNEVFLVPGAARVWLAHNHPSGSAQLSEEDLGVLAQLDNLLDGSGVEVAGILAIASTGKWSFGETAGEGIAGITDQGELRKLRKETTIPVVEREIVALADAAPVSSPTAAAAAIDARNPDDQPGVLLLDNRNRPLGFLPVPEDVVGGGRGSIRGRPIMPALLRALSATNASGVVIYTVGVKQHPRNLLAFFNAHRMKVVDALARVGSSRTVESLHSMGRLDVESKNAGVRFFQDAVQEEPENPEPPRYYSALRRALETVDTVRASPEGWKQIFRALVKRGLVKQEEIEWSGVEDYVDIFGGKIDRQDILAWLQTNGVEVAAVAFTDHRQQVVTASMENAATRLRGLVEEGIARAEAQGVGPVQRAEMRSAVLKWLVGMISANRGLLSPWPNLTKFDEEFRPQLLEGMKRLWRAAVRQTPGKVHYEKWVTAGVGEDYTELLIQLRRDKRDFEGEGPALPEPFEILRTRLLTEGRDSLGTLAFGEPLRTADWRTVVNAAIVNGLLDLQGAVDLVSRYAPALGTTREIEALRGKWEINYHSPPAQVPLLVRFLQRTRRQTPVMSREEVTRLLQSLPARKIDTVSFGASHWAQNNLLAHVRMETQATEAGEPALFVFEIQSDWAQTLRRLTKSGEAARDTRAASASHIGGTMWEARNASGALIGTLDVSKLTAPPEDARQVVALLRAAGNEVPGFVAAGASEPTSGPFVGNTQRWVQLALKEVIRQAIDRGADWVVLNDGTSNALLNDLAMLATSMELDRNGEEWLLTVLNGRVPDVQVFTVRTRRALAEYVGEDLAADLLEQLDSGNPRATVEFDTPQVTGGTPMVEFYDKIVPAAAKKLLSKLGGPPLERVRMRKPEIGEEVHYRGAHIAELNDGSWRVRVQDDGEVFPSWDAMLEALVNLVGGTEELHDQILTQVFQEGQEFLGFRLSPEFKRQLSGSGIPLFQEKDEGGEAAPGGPAPRGAFDPRSLTVQLFKDADLSTFLHEMAHYFLTVYTEAASLEDAPQELRDDVQAMLDWFGVQDIAAWNALTLEQQRAHHEAFALNFEQWLFEGRAPNAQMRGLFERFRTWLLDAYRSIKTELNAIYRRNFGRDLPILTGEVRDVMERMFSSRAAIERARAARELAPDFQTREESGLSAEQWEAYKRARDEAKEAAVTDLSRATLRQLQWLTRARSRILSELQKKHAELRKKVRAGVVGDLRKEPVYRLREWLRTGSVLDDSGNETAYEGPHKLLRSDVASRLDEGQVKQLAKRRMLADDGMPVDLAAETFGFGSPAQMLKELLEAPSLDEAAEQRTDEQMLERYGDMQTPEAIEREVQKALHNEAQARFAATLMSFFDKIEQPRRVRVAAAKEAARQALLRLPVREIRPKAFQATERRAARELRRAMKENNQAEAFAAAQRMLLANQMARQAIEVRAEIEKALRLFRKLRAPEAKLAKRRNIDLVHAARWILARYDLDHNVRSGEAIDQLHRYDPALFEALAPLLNAAADSAKPWRDLTLEEFRTLEHGISSLWWRSARDKTIEIEGQKIAAQSAVDQLRAQIIDQVPDVVPGERQAVSKTQKIGRGIMGVRAILRQVEHWARIMDGGGVGPFTRFIWRPIRERLNSYRTDRNNYIRRLRDMVAALNLPPGKIEASFERGEFDYVFGAGNGGNGKAELLGALLHHGNVSNRAKLLGGRRWGEVAEDGTVDEAPWRAFIDRMISEGVLTKEDFDFLQAVWDLLEEIKPLAQKAHREVYGTFFTEVQAEPITTPWGTYRGGYVPATTDPDLVPPRREPEDLAEQFRKAMPAAPSGFTKARVEQYREPLALDVGLLAQHVDDVLLFSHVQPGVRDVLRVLNNRDLRRDLERIDPTTMTDLLMPWLERAASQRVSERGRSRLVDAFWTLIRRNSGVAIMIVSAVNALQQFTGLINATLFVKGRHIRRATFSWLQRRWTGERIAQLSPFMDDRLESQVFELRNDLQRMLVSPSLWARTQEWITQRAYVLQRLTQNTVDIIVWAGAYEQAIEELGASPEAEAEAVRRADSAVRLSQGSFDAEDVAAYQVGTPFHRTWTQFTGYFNTVLNQIMGSSGTAQRVKTTVVALSLPMLVAEAIALTLRGQWDDEDDDGHLDTFIDWFVGSQARGAAALVPAFGPAVMNAIDAAFTGRIYGDRAAVSPAMATLSRSLMGAIAAGRRVLEGEEVSGRQVRDVVTLVSLIALPGATSLGRPLSYLQGVRTGEIDPQGPIDYLRGLVTGAASEASRR